MGTIPGCQDNGDITGKATPSPATTGSATRTERGGRTDTGGEETTATERPPDLTATETVVVSPETVKAWIDAGLVNSDPSTDAERVVIFRVGEIDSYEDGHLPGAFPWSPLHQQRLEALAPTSPMVPAGDVMDSLLPVTARESRPSHERECSDAQSDPRTEQGGRESRQFHSALPIGVVSWYNSSVEIIAVSSDTPD